MVDAKTAAVDKAANDIARSVAKAVSESIRPHLEALFDAGQVENMAALQRAMHSLVSNIPPIPPISLSHQEALGTPSKDGRAPRGAVRVAVMAVLRMNPQGLTTTQISEMAPMHDPRINGLSASNELHRNKGTLYKQGNNGLWTAIGAADAETVDLLKQNPEKDEATEP
jgi:hypothetical protein